MSRQTAAVVRANLRAWWPELLWVAFAGVLCLTMKDGAVGFVIVLLFSGVFWAMGFRHRHRPIFEVIRGLDAKLDAALEDDDRPDAEVRRLHSV